MAALTTSDATDPTAGRMVATGALAGLVGGFAALVVAVLALALGVSLEVTQPGGGVGPAPLPGFVASVVFMAIVGAGLALAARRWSPRPARTFVVVTVALTAVSFVQPIVAARDAATVLALIVAHIVAAAVVIPALARRLPTRR